MTTGRPVPVPDERSEPFWRAAADHVLVVARCERCGRASLPPEPVCPHCHHTDPELTFEPVSGHGTVCSWTVLHQSFVPGFDDLLPLTIVDVRLGAPARVTFEDLAPGVAVPAVEVLP